MFHKWAVKTVFLKSFELQENWWISQQNASLLGYSWSLEKMVAKKNWATLKAEYFPLSGFQPWFIFLATHLATQGVIVWELGAYVELEHEHSSFLNILTLLLIFTWRIYEERAVVNNFSHLINLCNICRCRLGLLLNAVYFSRRYLCRNEDIL